MLVRDNKPKRKRLRKFQWLDKSLRALPRFEGKKLTIDTLCEVLGVTKGSFYAHFDTWDDFITQLMVHYDEHSTQVVIKELEEIRNLHANQRLAKLIDIIRRDRLERWESAIRLLAAQEPAANKILRKVLKSRYEYVKSLFQELGYRGEELEIRTNIFVVYFFTRASVTLPQTKIEEDRERDAILSLFTN